MVTLTMLAALGCRSSGETTTTHARAPSPVLVDPATFDAQSLRGLLESQGDRGVAVIVRWPGRGADGFHRSEPNDPEIPELNRLLQEALDDDADELRRLGWDLDRPVVISTLEAPFTGSQVGVVSEVELAIGRPPGEARLSGLISRARIPARDVDALVRSLDEAIGGGRPRLDALVEGREGARAWGTLSGGWTALLPGPDHVQLVGQGSAYGSIDIETARSLLDVEPASIPEGPAFRNLVGARNGVLVRPRRIHGFAVWAGAISALQAIETVSPDMFDLARAKGTEIVLTSELAMLEGSPEIELWSGRSWSPEPGVTRLRAVADLTTRGDAWLEAMERGARPSLPVKVDDPEVSITLGLSMVAPAEGERLLPWLRPPASQDALEANFHEAGVNSIHYALLRHPLGALTQIIALALGEGTKADSTIQPQGAQVVLVSSKPLRVAGAMIYGSAEQVALPGLPPGVEAHHLRRGDDRIVLVGVGIDPREVFDAQGSAAPQPLESTTRALPLSDMLGPINGIGVDGDQSHVWVRHVGAALVLEGAFWWGEHEPAAPQWPSFDGSAPRPATPPSPGELCLARAVGALRDGLHATVVTRRRRETIEEASAPLLEGLACAQAHEPTATRAVELRRMAEQMFSALLWQGFDDDAALARLRLACTHTKDEALCARAEAMAAIPRPSLAEVEVPCGEDLFRPEVVVRLSPTAIGVGERRFDSTEEAIAAAVEATEASDGPRPFGLAVDAAVPTARLQAVLGAIRAAGRAEVGLALRDADDGAVRWNMVWFGALPDWRARSAGEAIPLDLGRTGTWGRVASRVADACSNGVSQ